MILLLAGAILTTATPAAAAPYEVVRAGDRAMACPQLIAEINDINRQLQAQQVRQTTSMSRATSGMMRGGGMGGPADMVLGSVAGLVPFGGTALSMGRQAQMAAGRQKMTDQMEAMQREAMEMMPVRERLDHLMGLYAAKAC